MTYATTLQLLLAGPDVELGAHPFNGLAVLSWRVRRHGPGAVGLRGSRLGAAALSLTLRCGPVALELRLSI